MRMIRTSRWKLILDFRNPGRDELYDLKSDSAESRNLIRERSAEIKATVKRLTSTIKARMKQIGDPVSRVAAK